MDTLLISVIVPVYNAGDFIAECIESILAQTVNDFELILIDDGSSDDSAGICDEYRQKDPRVRVIHKKNEGPSSARNEGLEKARGKYICFIDSDDSVRIDFLEKLYNVLTADKADMVLCDIEDPRLAEADMAGKAHITMTSRQAKRWLYDLRSREYVLMVSPCNKLFSADLFKGLRFPVGKDHEDDFIIGPLLGRCRMISYISEKLYVYRDNLSGFTADANRMNIKHLDGVDAFAMRISQAIDEKDEEFALVTFKNALYKCARFYKDAKELGADKMILASMAKYKELFNRFKGLLNFKQRVKYVVFTVFPDLFIRIYNP